MSNARNNHPPCSNEVLQQLFEKRELVKRAPGALGYEDEQTGGQLAKGAACYAMTAAVQIANGHDFTPPCYVHKDWPFRREEFFPNKPARENLISAALFIIAEIERLDRAIMRKRN